jgi:nicotinamidase-related amidase
MKNRKENALVGIDLQIDFTSPNGALFVKGANDDVKRIASMILRDIDQIDHIALTFDSHRVVDISQKAWWNKADGTPVDPFTPISLADIDSGKYYSTKDPKWSREYVATLEKQGKFGHYIWPDHCIIGSLGHAIDPIVLDAVHAWERKRGGIHGAEYVTKGTNAFTEHFGAFQAQVPIPSDPSTQANLTLLKKLEEYSNVYICGEAASHCLGTSISQILDLAPQLASKLVILEDCTSDVTGFEGQAQSIFDRGRSMGVRFSKSTIPIGSYNHSSAAAV